jgi:uncharacterized surface protein with fasciclin (FAS1) repeats
MPIAILSIGECSMSTRARILLAALALCLVPPVTGFAQSGRSAVAVVKADPQLATLAKAIEAAGLEAALSGSTEVTVLAPTDTAFAKLPAGALENLLKPENRAQLEAVLKNHVIAGKLSRDDLKKRRDVATLEGKSLAVRLERGNLMIGAAEVGKRERVADNGRVHTIDTVLLP